jgi:hypothetical protein
MSFHLPNAFYLEPSAHLWRLKLGRETLTFVDREVAEIEFDTKTGRIRLFSPDQERPLVAVLPDISEVAAVVALLKQGGLQCGPQAIKEWVAMLTKASWSVGDVRLFLNELERLSHEWTLAQNQEPASKVRQPSEVSLEALVSLLPKSMQRALAEYNLRQADSSWRQLFLFLAKVDQHKDHELAHWLKTGGSLNDLVATQVGELALRHRVLVQHPLTHVHAESLPLLAAKLKQYPVVDAVGRWGADLLLTHRPSALRLVMLPLERFPTMERLEEQLSADIRRDREGQWPFLVERFLANGGLIPEPDAAPEILSRVFQKAHHTIMVQAETSFPRSLTSLSGLKWVMHRLDSMPVPKDLAQPLQEVRGELPLPKDLSLWHYWRALAAAFPEGEFSPFLTEGPVRESSPLMRWFLQHLGREEGSPLHAFLGSPVRMERLPGPIRQELDRFLAQQVYEGVAMDPRSINPHHVALCLDHLVTHRPALARYQQTPDVLLPPLDHAGLPPRRLIPSPWSGPPQGGNSGSRVEPIARGAAQASSETKPGSGLTVAWQEWFGQKPPKTLEEGLKQLENLKDPKEKLPLMNRLLRRKLQHFRSMALVDDLLFLRTTLNRLRQDPQIPVTSVKFPDFSANPSLEKNWWLPSLPQESFALEEMPWLKAIMEESPGLARFAQMDRLVQPWPQSPEEVLRFFQTQALIRQIQQSLQGPKTTALAPKNLESLMGQVDEVLRALLLERVPLQVPKDLALLAHGAPSALPGATQEGFTETFNRLERQILTLLEDPKTPQEQMDRAKNLYHALLKVKEKVRERGDPREELMQFVRRHGEGATPFQARQLTQTLESLLEKTNQFNRFQNLNDRPLFFSLPLTFLGETRPLTMLVLPLQRQRPEKDRFLVVIHLEFPDYGSVRIDGLRLGGTLSVTFRLEKERTLQLLKSHAPQLHARLATKGLSVRSLSMVLDPPRARRDLAELVSMPSDHDLDLNA